MFSQDKKDEASLPRDVKDAVNKCRASTQEALKNRISRMDIEFPVGTKFGVEKGGTTKRKGSDGGPTLQDLQRSDRELARLFVEMFQPVGGDRIVVAFPTLEQTQAAQKQWNDVSSCRALSMDRRKAAKKQKKTKARGFAAKLAAEVDDTQDSSGPFQLPPETEVALFVAPGPKELVVIEKICETVGMGTLVVLLNARLDSISNFGSEKAQKLFRQEFERVFHLAAAPQEAAPNCLLHRAYPGGWIMARKPKVGQPKTILTQPSQPTAEECQAAFGALELTDVEKNVENVVENVANWFR